MLGLGVRPLLIAAGVWSVLSPVASQVLRSTVVPVFQVGEPDLRDLPVQLTGPASTRC